MSSPLLKLMECRFLGQSGHLIEKLVDVVFSTKTGSATTQSPLIMVNLALVTHFNRGNVVVQVNMILKLLRPHKALESVFTDLSFTEPSNQSSYSRQILEYS